MFPNPQADGTISLVNLEAVQSGTWDEATADKGVDGINTTCSVACTTCSSMSGQAWYQVHLIESYVVQRVALISNPDITNAKYLDNFVVMVRDDNSTDDPKGHDLCSGYSNSNIGTNQLIELTCSHPVQGRYLTFKRQGYGTRYDAFSTCEVFAWGMKARSPTTMMTSILPSVEYVPPVKNGTLINTDPAVNYDTPSDGMSEREIRGIILGAIFGFVILVIIIFFVFFNIFILSRRNLPEDKKQVFAQNSESESPVPSPLVRSHVRAEQFHRHVKLLRTSKGFLRQFMNLPEDDLHDIDIATQPMNQCKNRFQNIFPYDYNRVVIRDLSSDYINASFIMGCKGQYRYIATQDPIDVTIVEFWSMIWQNRISIIISLSNSFRFWPEVKESYGFVTVTMVTEEKYGNYCKRIFALDTSYGSIEVTQFQYLEENFVATPFHFQAFVRLVRNSLKENDIATVHCSGGIGFTGCFIAIDYLAYELESRDQLSVVRCIESLRHQRMNFVQTLEQFEFVHDVMLEQILIGRLALTWPKMTEKLERIMKLKARGKLELDKRYQVLEELTHDHVEKHGTGSLVKHEDIGIHSYKRKNAYWLKTLPDASEFDAFWKSIYEARIDTCVVIGLNIKSFWPIEINVEHCYDVIGVTCKETNYSDVIKTSSYNIVNHSRINSSTHALTLIHLDYTLPSKPADMFFDNIAAGLVVDLHMKITSTSSINSLKISFVSSDGVTHSGLLATAFFLLDTLKIERVADITGACRHVTSVQPHAISSTQYKFLHQVLLNFLKRGFHDNNQFTNHLCDAADVDVVNFDPIGSSFI